MEKEDIIAIVVAFLSSGILNAIISSVLYNKKLKRDLQNSANTLMSKQIDESLMKIRELGLKASVQEILNIKQELDIRGSNVNMFRGETIYPAIYNSRESLRIFHDEITECREKYEKNISVKLALNLVFIDRYIMQSSILIKEYSSVLNRHEFGALLIYDIQDWRQRFDKLVVKEINKHRYKLESHESRKWDRLRKKEIEYKYSRTVLNYLLTGKCCRKDEKRMRLLKPIRDRIEEETGN